jgi:hypothetical protein
MLKQILIAVFLTITISCFGQSSSKRPPDIFYISIGSCVYGHSLLPGSDTPALFPERVNIDGLLNGFEKDFVVYENDPRVIRRRDSLSTILHGVDWSQQEMAHNFVLYHARADTLPGDMYINRCDGTSRSKVMTISGSDTTERWEPPFLVDTLPQVGAFFDSSDFKGAKKSATMISKLLDKQGATGITISSYDLPISRNMFFAAVDSLWKVIQKAHKPNPIIVFYYCGHGYADGFGRRFLVPGAFSGTLDSMPLDIRRLRSVFIKDLYDYLELAGYPFILLLDCCSDNQGIPPKDDLNAYYKQLAINLDGVELDKLLYEHFFQPTGDAMVLYSSILGSNSLPVPDPIDKASVTFIGPLCRRLLLATKKHKDVFWSFENMKNLLMNPRLDKVTKTPGIYCRDCGGPLIPIEQKQE